MKKKKKKTIAQLSRKLTRAFNKYIRSKHTECSFCDGPVEHCFHFISAKKSNTRWDEDNVTASCKIDNLLMRFEPHVYYARWIKTEGLEHFMRMVKKSMVKKKWGRAELEGLILKYEGRIK